MEVAMKANQYNLPLEALPEEPPLLPDLAIGDHLLYLYGRSSVIDDSRRRAAWRQRESREFTIEQKDVHASHILPAVQGGVIEFY